MIRAILFDLDGTLLDSDMNTFLPHYFRALCGKLGKLVPPETLVREIMASTQRMIQDTDPTRTNEQIFADDFFPRIGYPREELMPLFEEFYERDFPALKKHTQLDPDARPVVEECFRRGYDVVVATNPVFPLRAVQHRLEWAGAAEFPYALVTTYENMHFCKPSPQYYLEIAERIGRAPGECIMFGDDAEADIAPAAAAGMRTFHIVSGQPGVSVAAADYHGALKDFHRLVQSWPSPRGRDSR